MQEEYDAERAQAICERALSYMREFGVQPDPMHYALLYNHTAGYNRALSNAVLRAVQERGALAASDAKQIHDRFFSVQDALNAVRMELSKQTSELATAMAEANECACDFSISLQGAESELQDADGDQAVDVIREMYRASTQMAEHNRELEQQLSDSRRQVEHLKHKIAAARKQVECDALTGLPGRSAFRQYVAHALEQVHQRSAPLTVLIVDIDSFKAYNKANGAEVADRIIKFVGNLIADTVGSECTVARYGGDRFAVLMPNTRLESAVRIAERIRVAAQAKQFVRKSNGRGVGRITLSIGAALYGYGDTADALIDRALECTRTAKDLGRNRVRSAANSDIQR